MSLFQMPSLRKVFASLDGFRSPRRRNDRKASKAGWREPRSLTMDPLEERILLTVSATTTEAQLVTEALSSISSWPTSATDEVNQQPAVAVDDDGNFVIVWTQNDHTDTQTESDGTVTVLDTDYNVYARYFTDSVQRITLDDSVLDPAQAGTYALLSLGYNGSEVQTLTLDTVTDNTVNTNAQSLTIYANLRFSFNGGTANVTYNEYDGAAVNAAKIQTALRNMNETGTDRLDNAIVTTSGTNEYTITFGDDQYGVDQPLIEVRVVSSSYGFLPGATIATERNPGVIATIPVSSTDPYKTAQAIETYFTQTREYQLTTTPAYDEASNEDPQTTVYTTRVGAPEVTVTPGPNADGVIDGTVFDITFTGASGKSDQPQLTIDALTSYTGTSLFSSECTVETTKGPSEVFQVNPVDLDDPFIFGHDYEDQYNPSVAMDADGTTFVITWQSTVTDTVDETNLSDIYACAFSPSGYQTDEIADPAGRNAAIKGVIRERAQREEVWTFAFNTAAAVEGTFYLYTTTGLQTGEITFDSTDLDTVASQIETQLAVYFPGISVQVIKDSNPYQFKVIFPNDVVTADTATIELDVAGTTNPLVYKSFLAESTTADDTNADAYSFRVNTTIGNPQVEPSVGMDADGNFVIAWSTRAQDMSYFNGVYAQRYNKYAEKLDVPTGLPAATDVNGTEWRVDSEDTLWTLEAYVAMSDDGHLLITWSETTDPEYLEWNAYGSSVRATLYAPDQYDDSAVSVLRSEWGVGGGGRSTAAFDANNDYAIAWELQTDSDHNGSTSESVHATMWNIEGAVIRSTFRVNSADLSGTSSSPTWPEYQGYAQIALDADGDMVVSYSGFGPDASQTVQLNSTAINWLHYDVFDAYDSVYGTNLSGYINWGSFNGTYSSGTNSTGSGQISNGDVDGVIETILYQAQKAGAIDTELGQISALLEQVVGLLRGDANGVMYSLFDTSATSGAAPQILATDQIVNSLRDGNNSRWYLTINQSSTGGNFVVQLWTSQRDSYELITIAPVYVNSVFLVEETRAAIEAALRAALFVGDTWIYQQSYDTDAGEGSVEVRTVASNGDTQELADRDGTYWDIDDLFGGDDDSKNGFSTDGYAVYEITFQGEVHDTNINLSIYNYSGTLVQGSTKLYPPGYLRQYESANSGTSQFLSSVGMTPEGSFVIAWKQYDSYSIGGTATSSYWYRYYEESSDSAGPKVTDVMGPDGSSLENGSTVNFSPGGTGNVVVVTFSEELETSGVNSVTNVSNWALFKDGVLITDGIDSISFGMNRAYDLYAGNSPIYDGLNVTQSNTWQAVVVLNDNLESGTYKLQALATTASSSGLTDMAGNTLSYNGFNTAGATYEQTFVFMTSSATDTAVTTSGQPGDENAHTNAETSRAIAASSSGDYVVVWTATDNLGRDRVYYRLYEANGTPALVPLVDSSGNYQYDSGVLKTAPCPVMEVDSSSAGAQRHANVAMDADGDFVVTWTEYSSSISNIKVQRFNALGNIVGAYETVAGSGIYAGFADSNAEALYGTEPTQVNSITYGNPKWSTVAMDPNGDFVVSWTTYGQEEDQLGATFGVFARQYSWSTGQPLNVEFQVNANSVGNQHSASVAMDANGEFIVAWISDQNGNDDIYYRMFAADGTPLTAGDVAAYAVGNWLSDQSYPSVALNLTGTVAVITWTSAAAPTAGVTTVDSNGDGVYAVQFNPRTGSVPTGQFLVNTTTEGNQGYSSVSIDHSGAYVITWSGRGTRSGQLDASGTGGVYYQRYTNIGDKYLYETRANVLTVGDQWLSSIACDAKGNFVLVWTGVDTANHTQTDVFTYAATQSTQAVVGPWVSGVTVESGNIDLVQDATLEGATDYLVVLFDGLVSTTSGAKGLNSVMNLNNWVLMRNGVKVTEGLESVDFIWNAATRKYEATVTFSETLEAGSYVLIARDLITDGTNALDGDFNGSPGTSGTTGTTGFQFSFIVTSSTGTDTAVTGSTTEFNNAHTDAETAQAIAVDDDGDYVVVWTAVDALGRDRVYYRLYDAAGTPAQVPLVDSDGNPLGGTVACPRSRSMASSTAITLRQRGHGCRRRFHHHLDQLRRWSQRHPGPALQRPGEPRRRVPGRHGIRGPHRRQRGGRLWRGLHGQHHDRGRSEVVQRGHGRVWPVRDHVVQRGTRQ